MSACPDCGRPIAPSYEAWIADKGPDDEHLSCAAHTNLDDEDMWGDEAIPDCRMATILHLRAQLTAALAKVAELTEQLDYSRQQHQSTWAKLHRQTENITGLNARVQELSRELLPQPNA